jgi:2-polyprenyl-3-methyl-5-hydroxy-6-metoxy-1,4-benzoquinol methylase
MYKLKTECRACGHQNLVKFIDLGDQPLANSYMETPTDLPKIPLAVNLCRTCFHTQLTVVVDPDEMFKNYLYVSGTSQTLKDYSDWFAQRVTEVTGEAGVVLDIACNDGTQLDSFKKLGWTTVGVDPAENIVPMAREKGHAVFLDYWSSDVAKDIGPVDAITAQNVFAHTDDILSFLLACKECMHEGTQLVIQTSQANMYKNGEFDTIYHEHLSFFNTHSMQRIVERAGLALTHVEKSDIHGTSYMFFIQLHHSRGTGETVEEMIDEEDDSGLYDIQRYFEFGRNAKKIVEELAWVVKMLQANGDRVVGYGAAAKGMTVLNFGNIKLDYIIDDNPLKQGRYTPGTNTSIYGIDQLIHDDKVVAIVPLAWNFTEEIVKRVGKAVLHADEFKFIRYFPKLKFLAYNSESHENSR